jgi:hypothetical protein
MNRTFIYLITYIPIAIAQGCRQTLIEKNRLTQEITELREERLQRWKKQAETVAKIVTTSA